LKGNPRRRAELLGGTHVFASSLNEQVLPKSDLANLAMELTASPTLAGSVYGELNRMRRKPSINSAGNLELNETNNDNIRNIGQCQGMESRVRSKVLGPWTYPSLQTRSGDSNESTTVHSPADDQVEDGLRALLPCY